MARFMIKASEYKNVCKAVNDRKLAELKKEIIEILKKQDEKEVKKAIDYFNSQELHYTHLEKSFTGKWIEKAGYGIGTVRIWKGKKYKKIAPGKWARVFEKEGRGTNIAIGKLIARVQKIDNVEDLMAFVMQNKQRFVDENGVDLPVLDKLRAAVDERNGNVGSKEHTERETVAYNQAKNGLKKEKERLKEYEEQGADESELKKIRDNISDYEEKISRIEKERSERGSKGTSKPAETSKQTDYYKDISEVLTKDEKRRINEKVEEYSKENEWSIPAADMKKFVKDWQSALKETDKHTKAEKLYEIYSKLEDANWHDENKKLLAGNFEYFNDKYFKDMYGEEPEEKPAEKKIDIWNKISDFSDSYGNKYKVAKKEDFSESEIKEIESKVKELSKDEKKYGKFVGIARDEKWNHPVAYFEHENGTFGGFTFNNIELKSENKTYWIQDSKGNRITSEDAKKRLMNDIENLKEYKNEYLLDRLNPEDRKEIESEFEKTKNRSDAMKGNKNAYKGRVEDIQLKNGARLTTRDGNNYGFAKVSDDRKTSIFTKVKQDKRDGSFTVDYYTADANGRIKYDAGEEGLETDFEDMKSLEEGLNKFFERNPKSENEKSSKEIKSKTTKSPFKVFADKEPVGTFEKSGDNAVVMDATKEQKALFDSLNKAVSKDSTRPFMTDCYYDGENIISTDGRRLVCIKAGDIGIEPGYVKVNSDGNKIKLEKFEKDFGESQVKQFPNYKRVMPNNNTQEVQLNQKVLKEKLKTMKKEGAWDSKKNFRIVLEFVDGKVMLDGTQVGTADGVKFDSDEQNINIHAEYLADALGNEDSVSMFVSDNPTKAFSLSDNVSDIVIMPMYGDENSVPDYEARRAEKAGAKAEKAAKLSKNREANERLVSENFKDIDGQVERVYSNVDKKISDFSDEELKRNYDILNLNLDKIMDRSIDFVSKIVDKKTNASFATAYAYSKLKEKHPDVKEKFLAELEKRGISVKKSLFDDFITDMLVDEVIEDEEEVEENESEYNDYSAEQPELFNSTEFLVREALNRRYNCM